MLWSESMQPANLHHHFTDLITTFSRLSCLRNGGFLLQIWEVDWLGPSPTLQTKSLPYLIKGAVDTLCLYRSACVQHSVKAMGLGLAQDGLDTLTAGQGAGLFQPSCLQLLNSYKLQMRSLVPLCMAEEPRQLVAVLECVSAPGTQDIPKEWLEHAMMEGGFCYAPLDLSDAWGHLRQALMHAPMIPLPMTAPARPPADSHALHHPLSLRQAEAGSMHVGAQQHTPGHSQQPSQQHSGSQNVAGAVSASSRQWSQHSLRSQQRSGLLSSPVDVGVPGPQKYGRAAEGSRQIMESSSAAPRPTSLQTAVQAYQALMQSAAPNLLPMPQLMHSPAAASQQHNYLSREQLLHTIGQGEPLTSLELAPQLMFTDTHSDSWANKSAIFGDVRAAVEGPWSYRLSLGQPKDNTTACHPVPYLPCFPSVASKCSSTGPLPCSSSPVEARVAPGAVTTTSRATAFPDPYDIASFPVCQPERFAGQPGSLTNLFDAQLGQDRQEPFLGLLDLPVTSPFQIAGIAPKEEAGVREMKRRVTAASLGMQTVPGLGSMARQQSVGLTAVGGAGSNINADFRSAVVSELRRELSGAALGETLQQGSGGRVRPLGLRRLGSFPNLHDRNAEVTVSASGASQQMGRTATIVTSQNARSQSPPRWNMENVSSTPGMAVAPWQGICGFGDQSSLQPSPGIGPGPLGLSQMRSSSQSGSLGVEGGVAVQRDVYETGIREGLAGAGQLSSLYGAKFCGGAGREDEQLLGLRGLLGIASASIGVSTETGRVAEGRSEDWLGTVAPGGGSSEVGRDVALGLAVKEDGHTLDIEGRGGKGCTGVEGGDHWGGAEGGKASGEDALGSTTGVEEDVSSASAKEDVSAGKEGEDKAPVVGAAVEEPRARATRELTAGITREKITGLYHLPLKHAAARLGVCITTLKRTCRRLGINKWPRRELRQREHAAAPCAQQKPVLPDDTTGADMPAVQAGTDHGASVPAAPMAVLIQPLQHRTTPQLSSPPSTTQQPAPLIRLSAPPATAPNQTSRGSLEAAMVQMSAMRNISHTTVLHSIATAAYQPSCELDMDGGGQQMSLSGHLLAAAKHWPMITQPQPAVPLKQQALPVAGEQCLAGFQGADGPLSRLFDRSHELPGLQLQAGIMGELLGGMASRGLQRSGASAGAQEHMGQGVSQGHLQLLDSMGWQGLAKSATNLAVQGSSLPGDATCLAQSEWQPPAQSQLQSLQLQGLATDGPCMSHAPSVTPDMADQHDQSTSLPWSDQHG